MPLPENKITHLKGAMERAVDALRTDNLVKVRINNLRNFDYSTKYTGRGWLASDEMYGHFLSDMSDEEYNRRSSLEPGQQIRRARIGIENLFTKDLNGTRIEYEITVKARKLNSKS